MTKEELYARCAALAHSEEDEGPVLDLEKLEGIEALCREYAAAKMRELGEELKGMATKAERASFYPKGWDESLNWPIVQEPCLIIFAEEFDDAVERACGKEDE